MRNRSHTPASRTAGTSLAVAALAVGGAAQQLVFEPPLRSATPGSPAELLVADVGGTPDLDVVVNPLNVAGAGNPSIHLGAGDGTFGGPIPLLGTSDTFVDDVGDLDEDGDADLLTVRASFGSGAAFVRFGNGDGTFGSEVPIAAGSNPTQALFGDFDGNDDLDVLVVRAGDIFTDPGGFAVHFGAGDGTLSAPVQFESVGLGGRAVAGDMNGDQVDDVVAVHAPPLSGDEVLDVYLGSASQVFSKTATCAECTIARFSFVQDLVLGDFDADGDLDVGYSETGDAGLSQPALVEIRLNDGAGNLTAGSDALIFSNFRSLVTGDVDGDGDDDLIGSTPTFFTGPPEGQAVPNGETKIVRMENAVSETGLPLIVTTPGSRGLATGLVDGDAKLDVLSVDASGGTIDFLRNATYGPGEPFIDLGEVLAGSYGFPVLVAEGTLAAGSPFRYALSNAAPGETALLITGLTRIDLPFASGLLVPFPLHFDGPFTVDAGGSATHTGTWPAGSFPGVKLYSQFWFIDPAGFAGFAATTAVEATLP